MWFSQNGRRRIKNVLFEDWGQQYIMTWIAKNLGNSIHLKLDLLGIRTRIYSNAGLLEMWKLVLYSCPHSPLSLAYC